MPVFEKYIKMKEISQKSAAEIRKILADKNLFDVDLKAVCCELYALRCEFVYYFFSTQFEKHSEEIQKQIIESAEENLIVAKYCRMFCMCAGLYESEKKEDAFLLLKKYLHKELKAKINKNIFKCFEKADKTIASDFLWTEFLAWSEMDKKNYLRFLREAETNLSMDGLNQKINEWCVKNNLIVSNNPVLERKQETVEESRGKQQVLKIDDFSVEDLLKTIHEKYQVLENQERILQGALKENKQALEKTVSEKDYLQMKNSEILETLKGKIAEIERLNQELALLKKDKDNLNVQLRELNERLQVLQAKYENVESAYGQAGKTEIDSVLGNIRNRLSSEYDKFLEIKEKEPDIIYYDVLIEMLKEIYKVLKKNGITFN